MNNLLSNITDDDLKYNIDINKLSEIEKLNKHYKKIDEYINNLKKFHLISEVKLFLKANPNITEWCIALIKNEYDDTGFYSGIYTDFNLKDEKKHRLISLDYNVQYNKKIQLDTELHEYFNDIFNNYKLTYFSGDNNFILPAGIFKNNEEGFNEFMKIYLGESLYNKWKIDYEQDELKKTIPQAKNNKAKKI